MNTTLDTHDEAATAYETYDHKTVRLRGEALGSFAGMTRVHPSSDVSAVRFNTFYEAAHATPRLVLVSKPDDDFDDIQRLRNILVHRSSTDLVAEAFCEPFEKLVELLKSFSEASRVSIETPNFSAYWKPADAVLAYQDITRVLVESFRHAQEEHDWTDEKNERRCDLVDKEIDGKLTQAERIELEDLQSQMLAYRRKVAPRPIAEARRVHQQLLKEAAEQQD